MRSLSLSKIILAVFGFILLLFIAQAHAQSTAHSAKQITAAQNQDGRLEIFYVGTNNKIYHNWQVKPNSDWSGESALGGSAKQITAAQNQDGRLEIFYVGTNNKIYHNWQVKPNSDWSGEALLNN
jgi:ferric iron reductase protein FhuF